MLLLQIVFYLPNKHANFAIYLKTEEIILDAVPNYIHLYAEGNVHSTLVDIVLERKSLKASFHFTNMFISKNLILKLCNIAIFHA